MRLYDNLKCLLLDYGLLWDFDTQSRKSPVIFFSLTHSLALLQLWGCLSAWNSKLMQISISMFSWCDFFFRLAFRSEKVLAMEIERERKGTAASSKCGAIERDGGIRREKGQNVHVCWPQKNRALLDIRPSCKGIAWSLCFSRKHYNYVWLEGAKHY